MAKLRKRKNYIQNLVAFAAIDALSESPSLNKDELLAKFKEYSKSNPLELEQVSLDKEAIQVGLLVVEKIIPGFTLQIQLQGAKIESSLLAFVELPNSNYLAKKGMKLVSDIKELIKNNIRMSYNKYAKGGHVVYAAPGINTELIAREERALLVLKPADKTFRLLDYKNQAWPGYVSGNLGKNYSSVQTVSGTNDLGESYKVSNMYYGLDDYLNGSPFSADTTVVDRNGVKYTKHTEAGKPVDYYGPEDMSTQDIAAMYAKLRGHVTNPKYYRDIKRTTTKK